MSLPGRPVRFGVVLPQFGVSWRQVVDFAVACDRLDYDSLWAVDHFYGVPDPATPIFEGWTQIAALAGLTERIRLGHQVLCVSYRHPPVLAKMAATLDHASQGRFTLGLGAGWFDQEYRGYGLEFPPIGTRLQQLDEALAIIRKLWTEEPVSYFGAQFNVEDAYCRPRPIQQPHPPILVGGAGERILLKLVAEHANMWNNLGVTHGQLPRKIAALRRHCDALKRDLGEIEISQQTIAAIGETEAEARAATEQVKAELPFLSGGDDLIITGRAEECIERVRRTVELGATTLVMSFGRQPRLRDLELFAERVIPAFR